MSCEIVIAPTNPLLDVDVVNQISADFSSKVYLTKIYPIAYLGTSQKGEDTHTYPRVYLNDGKTDYIDVMPDDKEKGITFFEIEGLDNYDRLNQEYTLTLNQIFWFNLRKIDNRGYDYTHELLADVLKTIDNGSYGNEIVNVSVEQNFENIYSKYSLPESQFFMYPYTGFKLSYEMIICQDFDCVTDFTIQVGGSDC